MCRANAFVTWKKSSPSGFSIASCFSALVHISLQRILLIIRNHKLHVACCMCCCCCCWWWQRCNVAGCMWPLCGLRLINIFSPISYLYFVFVFTLSLFILCRLIRHSGAFKIIYGAWPLSVPAFTLFRFRFHFQFNLIQFNLRECGMSTLS